MKSSGEHICEYIFEDMICIMLNDKIVMIVTPTVFAIVLNIFDDVFEYLNEILTCLNC